jgi:hypothetical protein
MASNHIAPDAITKQKSSSADYSLEAFFDLPGSPKHQSPGQ